MRLAETCCCGASIEIGWDQPRNRFDRDGQSEAARAEKELAAWRRRHKNCQPIVSPLPPSSAASRGDGE